VTIPCYCGHLTKLNAAVVRGELEAPKRYDPLLEVLWQRGAAHERAYVAHLEAAGLDVALMNADDVVLNILARQRDPGPPATILTPAALTLRHAPNADCARYDNLRSTI